MHDAPPPLTLNPAMMEGWEVRLEPLDASLRNEVQAALDVDAESWAVHATSGHGDAFEGWWRAATTTPSRIAYAVRLRLGGRVVGTSSFLEIAPAHRRLEIGSTFLHPDVRGTAVNPAIKRLMLAAAFEARALRVEIITDVRNLRSQAAIAKLGAVREGVLRRHKVTWTGFVRDTVMYAVTDQDWPAVRDGLDARLAGGSPPP